MYNFTDSLDDFEHDNTNTNKTVLHPLVLSRSVWGSVIQHKTTKWKEYFFASRLNKDAKGLYVTQADPGELYRSIFVVDLDRLFSA